MKIRPVGTDFPFADGRTDGHDEANSRFSKFCKCAQKLKKKQLKTNNFVSLLPEPVDGKSVTLHLISPKTMAERFMGSRPQNIDGAFTLFPQAQFPESQSKHLTILFLQTPKPITFASYNRFGLVDSSVHSGKE
jgi:hypothetical protein